MNRARDNGKAKASVGDVRTASKGLKAAANAGRNVDNKASGNADHKAEGNEAPAVGSAVARLAIRSFWPSTRTVMVNCRAAK